MWDVIYPIVYEIREDHRRIKVTLVKGHATDEQVAAGICTQQEKDRNEGADLYAEDGQKEHPRDRIQLLSAIARAQVSMLAQTMIPKNWETRLELINYEQAREMAEDDELAALEKLEGQCATHTFDDAKGPMADTAPDEEIEQTTQVTTAHGS